MSFFPLLILKPYLLSFSLLSIFRLKLLASIFPWIESKQSRRLNEPSQIQNVDSFSMCSDKKSEQLLLTPLHLLLAPIIFLKYQNYSWNVKIFQNWYFKMNIDGVKITFRFGFSK